MLELYDVSTMSDSDCIAQVLSIPGWLAIEEITWLADVAKECNIIIEIGSWKGKSTKLFALCTKGVVFSVDHWEGSPDERSTTQQEATHLGPEAIYSAFYNNLRDQIKAKIVIPIR